MKKFRYLYIEMYGINIYFIRCPRTLYKKRVKYEFGQESPVKQSSVEGTFEVYVRKDLPIGVIWLSGKSDIGHLVHECLHCVHFFFEDKGLFLSGNSEESYAYLIQHIFNKTKNLFGKKR